VIYLCIYEKTAVIPALTMLALAAGGKLGFKDGHVERRDFEFMTRRTPGGPFFWW
jgi:hypothetical protein